MTYWVCKMCGRSMRQDEKPNWCYFDRSESIENISDEDAVKMGLNIPEGERFEFPGDVRWDPDRGVAVVPPNEYVVGYFYTLKDWQQWIMKRVIMKRVRT